MADVWYVGGAGSRTITAAQWAASGIAADAATWSAENGWSLPHSDFSTDQLAILDADDSFVLDQSGPRVFPAPNPTPVGVAALASAHVYYVATRKLLQDFESAAEPATRTGIFPFDLCHAQGSWAAQPFSQRRVFRVSQTVKRFRIHLANYNQLSNTWGTAMTSVRIGIGVPVIGSDGLPTGATISAPVTLQAATSVAAGAELVTPWITPSTFEIAAYRQYMLTYGFVTAASSPVTCHSTGLSWQTFDAADAVVTNPAGMTRVSNAAFLWPWIEYEYADDGAPSILVVGNSVSSAANAGGIDYPGEMSNWHQVWALGQRGIAANIAVAGSFAAHFMAGNTRWNVYDSCDVMPDFDAVVYFAATSSDTIDNSIATAKADFAATVARGKALWPKARHIATNIPPRGEFTGSGESDGTPEHKRFQMNTWHALLGGGVEQCVDIDSLVTNWADPARLRSEFDTDGTHPNHRAHNRWGSAIASAIGTRRSARR